MSMLYRLGREGHSTIAEWKNNDAAAAKIAGAEFDKLLAQGFTMFDISDNLVGRPVMKAFDPRVSEIVAVPRLVGG